MSAGTSDLGGRLAAAGAGPDPVVLRIYTGPHCGAELTLTEGRRYTVGNSLSADIVVNDPDLHAEHLELLVDAGRVRVIPTHGDVLVDGRPLAANDNRHHLAASPIDIGATRFTVGTRAELPGTFSERSLGASDPGVRALWVAACRAAGRRPKQLYMGGAMATFVAFALMIFSHSPETAARSGADPVAAVRGAIPIAYRDGLSVRTLPEGQVLVRGYVDSEAERLEITDELEPFGQSVTINVWSAAGMIETANGTLASLGMSDRVRALSSSAGTISFGGFVRTRGQWEKALVDIRDDVPGIAGIDDVRVDTVRGRAEKLRAMLEKQGIDTGLQIAVLGDEILLKGTVDSSAFGEIRTRLHQFQEEFGDDPALIVQISEAEVELLDLDIRSVAPGPRGYVVTESGDRYMAGGRFDNGYVVRAIEPGQLLLSKNGQDYTYPLEE